MNELDRTFLDAARAEMGPTEAERRRLRGSVLGAVAATTVVGTATAASSASAAASAAGTATAVGALAVWKAPLIASAVVVAMIGGAWVAAAPSASAPNQPPHATDAPGDDAPGAPLDTAARGAPLDTAALGAPLDTAALGAPIDTAATGAALDTAATDAPLDTAATGAPLDTAGTDAPAQDAPALDSALDRERPATGGLGHAPVAARERSSRVPARRAATPSRLQGDLDAETALLGDAHAALQSGQPVRALDSLALHAARHPGGFLVEEREATRVLALCAAGRVAQARAEAAAFLAAHPRSVHRERVGAACAP